jgi:hypothetical protein
MVDANGNTWTDSLKVTVTEPVPVPTIGPQIVCNSYVIHADNNNDKVINKGETIELKVSLKNTGTSTANAVKATFSTTSTYISELTPTTQVNYGAIAASGIKWADYYGSVGDSHSSARYYTIKFTVSKTTPDDTQIPININIVDANGNTWTDSLKVTVTTIGAQIICNSYIIYADNNDDGVINKGETIELKVSLKNTGTSTANAVKATFSTTSTYISGLTPTTQVNYGAIAASGIKWADYYGSVGDSHSSARYYTIKFTVSKTTPDDTQIPISISIVDQGGNIWTDSLKVTVTAIGAQIICNSYIIHADNNDDGVINKGETVELKVSLKNTGTSTANAVKATFSTTSTYISGLTPTTQVNYGYILASGIRWADYYGSVGDFESSARYYTIKFTVSKTTPDDTQIPINISIVDQGGNIWTDDFNITVEGTKSQIAYNTFSIHSDSNNDGVVNKGETVELKVSLKNTGTSTANAVKATFSTTSTYVSEFTPTTQVSYGYIVASGVRWADYYGSVGDFESSARYYTIKFTVSKTTPDNTQIPINISIVDQGGNIWTDVFDVTVEGTKSQIAYNSFSIHSDNNNDGAVNKGETIELKVSLKNTGTSTANAVKATFSTTSTYISGLTPTTPVSYGYILASGIRWADYYGSVGDFESSARYYTIKFTVSNTTPDNIQIPINISIIDQGGNIWTDSFNVPVQ